MEIKNGSALNSPSDNRIHEFESFHRVKLPADFIQLLKQSNGGVTDDLNIEVDGHSRLVERFLCLLDDPRNDLINGQYEISVVIAQIEDRLTDDEDQVGATLIPFAVLFGGDFLCIDFRLNRSTPTVVLWDHEESDELDPVTYQVADTFNEFLNRI